MHALALVLGLVLGQYTCSNGQCQLTTTATVASTVTPVALPGHHIEYRTETRYRTETQYQTQRQCNGNSCSLVSVPVSVSVPYQAQIAYSIPNAPAKPAASPVRSTPKPKTVVSTPKCCEECTCKVCSCCGCCNKSKTDLVFPASFNFIR